MKVRRLCSIAFVAAYLALTAGMAASFAGCGGSSANASTPSEKLLPRNYVVLLALVNQYFDTITQPQSTGEDSTAQGNPNATRAVFFVNGDGSQLVTITVDRYKNNSDASSAHNASTH